jgi:hypothetical protein
VLVGLSRVLLLNSGGVGKHQPTEIGGACRAEHASAISLRNKPRQQADVVQVSMRQDNRIDRLRRHREGRPVSIPQLFQTLEHAAVDQHASGSGVEQVFGSGDGASRTKEDELSQLLQGISLHASTANERGFIHVTAEKFWRPLPGKGSTSERSGPLRGSKGLGHNGRMPPIVTTAGHLVPCAVLYMKQAIRLDCLWAGLCLLGAVYFTFRM